MKILKIKSQIRYLLVVLVGLMLVVHPPLKGAQAVGVMRAKLTSGSIYLVVEALRDDIVHFELGNGTGPDPALPLYTTSMVAKMDYTGPTTWSDTTAGSTRTFQTPSVKVDVNTSTLCVTETDKANGNVVLTTLCPLNMAQAWKGITITQSGATNVYGLGEKFMTVGSADGDWVGQMRASGSYGNVMEGWNGGSAGNAQFPIMYALGSGTNNYALFMDNIYKQTWTFNTTPWKAEMWGDQLSWYMLTGPNLQDLRQDYMDLVGHPLVPPKKALGLWVSEYGYDNWGEVDTRLNSLRTNQFPVDGFVLDLQWFGGITANSDNTNMGRLTWDTVNFPNATTKLSDYKNNSGIGIITIEESYIGKALAEWTDLSNRGYLVRAGCSTCAPVYLTSNPWWGKGGMIDWTNDAASDYWFDLKRQALINAGVMGHWTDLGEPEMYDTGDWTSGILPNKHAHADYHNVYNVKWAQSIARGYTRNNDSQRPLIISRSGAPGIQRYGTAMWSGDIGSNFANLATQQNAQMHMSLSGMDYFGSDVGGFHREACGTCDMNNLYTQWLANSSWFDIPVRPHTENLCNCKQTAPDMIGDTASNLANLRQRYELGPYLYSLAYRAYLYGEPVFPPLVYYYQTDANVRTNGNEKLVGRDLLVAIVASQGETQRGVYLPAGDWVNYHTNAWYHSTGQTYTNIPEYINGIFRLPAFARAGAILPKMFVDANSMNILGKRTDGSTRDELITRVYGSPTATSFTLYEDDGATKDYTIGATRTTMLSQQKSGSSETVTIAASSGTYTGASASRNNVVELVTENQNASDVTLNGSALTQYATQAAFDAAASGWFNAAANLILAKSGSQAVSSAKTFVFTLGAGPTPTPTQPPGTGTGLSGEYYDNMDFTVLKLTRTDATINFNWALAAPDASMGADQWSVRWTGQVQPQYSQTYTFYTQTDDGVRLWVNSTLLIDHWVGQAETEWSGTIALTAGQQYSIKMEFYDDCCNAVARLLWSSSSQAKQVIPQTQLYPPGPTATPTKTNTPGPTNTPTKTNTPGPTATPTPTPTGGIDPTLWYKIVGQNSGKCINARAGGTANDTAVEQKTCATSNSQNWKFTPTSGGYYQIGNRNAVTQVIDVSGISTSDGALLHLWAYVGGNNQQWQPISLGGGYYKFVARHSGKCIDVPNNSTADGLQLQQWTCNGTTAQSWSLTSVP